MHFFFKERTRKEAVACQQTAKGYQVTEGIYTTIVRTVLTDDI